MKLKEKLAYEGLNENKDSLLSAFIKGFDKARDLSREILFHELNDRTPAAAMIYIGQLGEKEV